MNSDLNTEIICEPKAGDHRFVLGKKGKCNLLIIALNPNTASAQAHDSTTRNIERIAQENGYDGWVLFNLSPVRNPKPENLLDAQDKALENENLRVFQQYVKDSSWSLNKVWLSWGNGVLGKDYLTETAIKMLDVLKPIAQQYYCIKRTQQHHPYHSAQRSRFVC